MEMELKYYKYTDPYTGNQSKSIGWVIDKIGWNVAVKEINGDAVITRNQAVEQHLDYKPRFGDPEEITKEEYDALDTKGESQRAIMRRENDMLASKKLLRRAEDTEADISPAVKMQKRMIAALEARKGKKV